MSGPPPIFFVHHAIFVQLHCSLEVGASLFDFSRFDEESAKQVEGAQLEIPPAPSDFKTLGGKRDGGIEVANL